MPPFGTPASKHGAAILGLHALPETVRFRPFAIVWLKCSFWHCLTTPGKHNATLLILQEKLIFSIGSDRASVNVDLTAV